MMKPTDAYIEWLKAHPAVWEALQEEWEPQEGDWYTYGSHKVAWLVDEHELRAFEKAGQPKMEEEKIYWLPDLGRLVRMLEKTECGFTLYSPDIEDDELEYTLTSYKIIDFDMDEELPEIACTALWAKVKGVE